ncbi:Asp-tRNA(Asn)/Glu-tRNA(Gln) amidotransferase subunit GatC [Marinoscillum sp. MHG1-6]|uniref:Asp-tRNA(Asn)/Glu-tRNA(Gln) amidotransferase subunit GatC n=1 Tax=Marinoscillum sp. MHG1-6 TaxID=2959627 RepID=UPI0021570017|nr:Asp-tRNA(Asn)/Glu-tRNA(Gln) amidotransferase subunit GatC [Marinoscillum sp. MHG1-6]
MNIDSETLQKIAHLARLELDASHEGQMKKDLEEILEWVDKLNELDTDGIEPLTNMSFEVNSLREDKVTEPLSQERGLRNAPDKEGDYFKVPKVLE